MAKQKTSSYVRTSENLNTGEIKSSRITTTRDTKNTTNYKGRFISKGFITLCFIVSIFAILLTVFDSKDYTIRPIENTKQEVILDNGYDASYYTYDWEKKFQPLDNLKEIWHFDIIRYGALNYYGDSVVSKIVEFFFPRKYKAIKNYFSMADVRVVTLPLTTLIFILDSAYCIAYDCYQCVLFLIRW